MIRFLVCLFLVLNVIIFSFYYLLADKQLTADLSLKTEEYLPQVERLSLLSELSAVELVVKVEKKDAVEEEPVAGRGVSFISNRADSCYEIEGYDDKDALDMDRLKLQNVGFEARIEVGKVEVPGSFVVYVEPFVSQVEARRQLVNLQSKGVDSFLIAEGPRSNGISLGVFATIENANEHKEILDTRDYGYDIKVAQFLVERERYKLILKANSEKILGKTDAYFALEERSSVSVQEKSCIEVAS